MSQEMLIYRLIHELLSRFSVTCMLKSYGQMSDFWLKQAAWWFVASNWFTQHIKDFVTTMYKQEAKVIWQRPHRTQKAMCLYFTMGKISPTDLPPHRWGIGTPIYASQRVSTPSRTSNHSAIYAQCSSARERETDWHTTLCVHLSPHDVNLMQPNMNLNCLQGEHKPAFCHYFATMTLRLTPMT